MDPPQPPLPDWTKPSLSLCLDVFSPIQWAWWPFVQLIPLCQCLFLYWRAHSWTQCSRGEQCLLSCTLANTTQWAFSPQGHTGPRSFCSELFSLQLSLSSTEVITSLTTRFCDCPYWTAWGSCWPISPAVKVPLNSSSALWHIYHSPPSNLSTTSLLRLHSVPILDH